MSLRNPPAFSLARACPVRLAVATLVLAAAGDNLLLLILGFIAVVFAAGNVVGGFVVTDRMLQMFKPRGGPGGKK